MRRRVRRKVRCAAAEGWEGADPLRAESFAGLSSSGPVVVSFEEPRLLGAGTNKDMRAFMVRFALRAR